MRAIIIEEARFSEVVSLMKAAAKRTADRIEAEGREGRPASQIAEEIYRAVQYEFINWAQSHGATCL